MRAIFCAGSVVEVGGSDWTSRDGYTLKEGARRFETWEVSYALQLGLGGRSTMPSTSGWTEPGSELRGWAPSFEPNSRRCPEWRFTTAMPFSAAS